MSKKPRSLKKPIRHHSQDSDVIFAISKEGGLEWFYPEKRPDLTAEQALVIAVSELNRGLREIASGLHAIADSIRFRAETR